jgi:tRNA threonylcarbamoyladenosine biosynthesis protein TsaE
MNDAASGVQVETSSPEETAEFGRRLGELCEAGTLVALLGDLGAGKTRFVKGLARGLGIAEHAVTSPTFVLMNLYAGRLRLAHFDLYRLESVDLPSLGFLDVRDDGVVVLEWADKAEEKHLGDHLRIAFEITGERSRRLMLQARGERSRALLDRLNLSPKRPL